MSCGYLKRWEQPTGWRDGDEVVAAPRRHRCWMGFGSGG